MALGRRKDLFVDTGERAPASDGRGRLRIVWRYIPPDEAALQQAEEEQRQRRSQKPEPPPFLGKHGSANG